MFIVIIQKYFTLMSFCKGPSISGLWKSIHNTVGDMKIPDELVQFFPFYINPEVDNFPCFLPVPFCNHDMKILSLVNTH